VIRSMSRRSTSARGTHRGRRGHGAGPRVNDKRIDEATGQRCRFSAANLPAWAPKSPHGGGVAAAVSACPSTSDFAAALEQFLGTSTGCRQPRPPYDEQW
jgi:hypothetical protein